MATSKFIIIRRDLEVDPTAVEGDGLSIGRLLANDVTLNHPSVSRTHLGIRQISGDFWVTNLSQGNGTILNGAIVESAPLAAGDILQVGPFYVHVAFPGDVLELTIDLSMNPMAAEGGGTGLLPSADASSPGAAAAAPADPAHSAQAARPSQGGTRRLTNKTGMLTGMLAAPEEFALKVFWDKRKRDAGKVAERTPLKPNLMKGRLGKARFNWRSTSDLRRPWATSLFVWGAILVTAASVVSAFAFTDFYAPGPLATAHVRDSLAHPDALVAVAVQPNANSCTTCHSLTQSMDSRCSQCHTTTAFTSISSEEHMNAGVTCGDCHGKEHRGDVFAKIGAADSCVACHREGYAYWSPTLKKSIALAVPHGGSSLGYPVADGKWTWPGWSEERWSSRSLPKKAADYDIKGQFHIIHVANGGPSQRVACSDCHTKGFDTASILAGVRESCSACHAQSFGGKSDAQQAAVKVQCMSCHGQHGGEKASLAVRQSQRIHAEKAK
ncbi:MAG: FHA domain-containing protein [Acidobacteria bacterium]|nr:FHA domain-containing protein [Acidobacteriota bacterium]